MSSLPLTRRSIFAQAWPIMLGQASVPLVGFVDTAVIGRTGNAAELAGVALGATVINLIFWSFGFLRMGITGMTAQAAGARDDDEVRAMLVRGLAAGLALGLVLFAAQLLLIPAAFAVLAGSPEINAPATEFVEARFLGAPAALGFYALIGWLFGLGRSRAALALQVVMNVANIALDVLFVWHFDMGARGVGYGTACAEWIALATGLVIAAQVLGRPGMIAMKGRIRGFFAAAAMRRMFAVNADIMIRTVALLILFTWFANAGARLGAAPLAANHVLMQLVSFAAFVLDGFAFTAESRVGMAIGAASRAQFLKAIRLTGEFSLGAGMVFTFAIALAGTPYVAFMTQDPQVRAAAGALIPYVAILPLLGVVPWLLDGIFIGATQGRALRNAALASTALYIGTDLMLRPFGAHGVWLAMLAAYVYRAGALGWHFPALLRRVERGEVAQHPVGP